MELHEILAQQKAIYTQTFKDVADLYKEPYRSEVLAGLGAYTAAVVFNPLFPDDEFRALAVENATRALELAIKKRIIRR